MTKLASTAKTAIAMTFLVMNLEYLLQQFLFVFLGIVLSQRLLRFNRWQWHWCDPQHFLIVA
jgi:hypothetical protein